MNTWTVANLVQYTGIFKHEGKAYAEFWTLHPYVPSELFPCEGPKVFERPRVLILASYFQSARNSGLVR